jgi:glycosyltransferase involved in cell wall biosynthesis
MINNLVSVIIPTYNHDKFIGRAIESLINQDYNDWEAIIVDNFSSDNTEYIINNYTDNRIKYYKFQNDGIIAKARNYAITLASGNIIAFLDSDDWWSPNKLSTSTSILLEGYDFVYHDLYISKSIHQKSYKKKVKTRELNSNPFEDLLNNGNAIATSSVVLNKEFIINVSLFSEDIDLVGGEDYECWLKISNLTNKFRRINKTLGYYTIMQHNMTSYRRNIKYCNFIAHKYIVFKNQIPQWLLFTRGYSLFKEKNYKLALNDLFRVKFGYVPLTIYLKKISSILKINFFLFQNNIWK